MARRDPAAGYAETAIAAFGVLTVFALAWIAVMKRFAEIAAFAAVTVIVVSEINLALMMMAASPRPCRFALSAHVIGFVILLIMVTRYALAECRVGGGTVGRHGRRVDPAPASPQGATCDPGRVIICRLRSIRSCSDRARVTIATRTWRH